MRIALIASPDKPVPPRGASGAHVMIDVEARALAALGHEVELWTTGDSTCKVPRKWVVENSRDIQEPGPSYELQHVIAAYDSFENVDIVHDHSLAGLIYSERFPSLKIVTTNHGPFISVLNSIFSKAIPRVKLVAISESHAQQGREFGVNADRVVHHGIDTENFRFNPEPGEYLLFLARMVPEKGILEAIDAAQGSDMPLKIAGRIQKSSEREFFDSEVKPRLGNSIDFLGEASFTEKRELLSNAAALINPIQWAEPFGLAMIEAGACGTPVITSPIGSAPEIVHEGTNGFLCKNYEERVAAIKNLPMISREACRKVVDEEFSGAAMARGYASYFQELLNQ